MRSMHSSGSGTRTSPASAAGCILALLPLVVGMTAGITALWVLLLTFDSMNKTPMVSVSSAIGMALAGLLIIALVSSLAMVGWSLKRWSPTTPRATGQKKT